MSSIKDLIRQCVSPFIAGPEINAILDTITEEALRQEQVSLAAYDQLYISTASDKYLEKRASEVGVTKPRDLGLEDQIFKNIVIDITAVKQVPSIIHSILETFYGAEAVRTYAQTGNPEPYPLAEGMQLIWEMDGKEITYEVQEDDFPPGHMAQATSDELASAITKVIRANDSTGFAETYVDPDTNLKYTRIISGVRGPTGIIKISGGELETVLNFPTLVEFPLPLPLIWTTWIINKVGSTIRFSWLGNADPHLENVREGDIALIYGNNFTGVGLASTDLRGSFRVTKVQTGNVWGIGVEELASYFEIENLDAQIGISENITISQGLQNNLRFYRQKIFRPYLRPRYSLAWEADGKSLKVYLPAVARVVRRFLEGSAHIRYGRSTEVLIGNFGSNSVDSERIIVLNEFAFKFAQIGLDIIAYGGTVTTSGGIKQIDYIKREGDEVTVVCLEPHQIVTLSSDTVDPFNTLDSYQTGNITEFGGELFQALQDNLAPSTSPPDNFLWGLYADDTPKSDEVVTVAGVPIIDDAGFFPGPYTYDPAARYTLSSKSGTLTQDIIEGQRYQIISVNSTQGIPDAPGFIMLNLNGEHQEEPIPIVGVVSNGFLLDPSYKFQYSHPSGTDFIYLLDNKATISAYGDDYPLYATDTVSGRIYCQDLITQVTALGIKLEIVIVYPDGVGLGNGKILTDGSDYRNNDLIWIYGE